MHVVPAAFFAPKRQGATVRVENNVVVLFRGSQFIGRYVLNDCSWFVGAPRHDTSLARHWAFIFFGPRNIIIEFPERDGWLLRTCCQRAAVGWSPEKFREWHDALLAANVAQGRRKSADPDSIQKNHDTERDQLDF